MISIKADHNITDELSFENYIFTNSIAIRYIDNMDKYNYIKQSVQIILMEF